MSNFLNLHSLGNHEDFCLAYVFTYRYGKGCNAVKYVCQTAVGIRIQCRSVLLTETSPAAPLGLHGWHPRPAHPAASAKNIKRTRKRWAGCISLQRGL